jgi:3-hydroxymyristoyl/3-hydroxydecanoyl-(acyl carrier protein) dehydratase
MTGRFSAFSFVDRITRLDPGVRVEGAYTVPPSASRFPASLMAESVGQLAAWAAMARAGFQRRPVAGLARETRYAGTARPGDTLELEVELEACDDEAVAYGGRARVNGACVLELSDCVGPMLPMEAFDSPDAVRADWETLRGPGAPAGRFAGVPEPDLRVVDHVAGERLRAELVVPATAPYFADHFPRRPVFPGTLLLDAQAALAVRLAGETAPLRNAEVLVPVRVIDVKIRSFTPPGQILEIRVELLSATGERANLSVSARGEGKAVATARIEVIPGRTQ